MPTIKSVLAEHIQIRPDAKFVRAMAEYVIQFSRSSSDTIEFLGSPLLGVYSFKWLESDRLVLLEDILNIPDYEQLRTAIYEVPAITPSYRVSSDGVNLSLLYITHLAMTLKGLSSKEADILAMSAMRVLNMKLISSIHTHNFKYPANEGIALATYESLDRKSMIKNTGSWGRLIELRSRTIIEKESIHYDVIRKFSDDEEIIKTMNDIQNRVKSILVTYTERFYKIRDLDTKYSSRGKHITIDGEEMLRDSANKYDTIRSRMHHLIPDRNALITPELIGVVVKTLTTIVPVQLESALGYISENYNSRKYGTELTKLVDDILLYTFEYMRATKTDISDIPSVVIRLKQIYRSSRAADPLMLSIRERALDLVERSVRTKSTATRASVRIGVIIYIVMRALLE